MAQLDIKPLDIHPEVCDVYGENQTICRWMAKYRSGLKQLEDAVHPGKPATATAKQNIEKIRKILHSRPMQDAQ